jgi:hypothetical protein
MEVMYAKARRARIRSIPFFLILIFPVLFGGCGSGQHFSDFSLQFDLGQPSIISIPPGKSVTVRLTIGFTQGSPGEIRVSFGVPPAGVSLTPNSITFKTAGEEVPVQFTAALDAPNTSAPVPLTITGVAGSITHSITLYIAVAPEQ